MFKAVSAALLALALVGPTGVSAATPDLEAHWFVIPTTVNNGTYVAFRGEITNNDSSTVSQLFLVELVRDPNLTLISVTASQGTPCDTTGTAFMCSLGQLKPHKTAKVTAVFLTAVNSAPPAPPITSATERWEFNTTGLGSGGGDNSHGDSWPSFVRDPNTNEITEDFLTVALSDNFNFGGRYVLNSTLKIVENSQALSSSNPHSTRAYSPVTGIGVTVEDLDCTVTDPPTDLDPICDDFTAGFGEVSKVNVNDGIFVDDPDFTGVTPLHFYLQLDSSEIPQGTNANEVSVIHVLPGGGTETIVNSCTFARKATIPNNAPCLTVKNLPGGDLGIDVWTFSNGGLRAQ
jgi:hypothetical protein